MLTVGFRNNYSALPFFLSRKFVGGSEKSVFDFHNTPKKLFLHHKEIKNLLCRISAESF